MNLQRQNLKTKANLSGLQKLLTSLEQFTILDFSQLPLCTLEMSKFS